MPRASQPTKGAVVRRFERGLGVAVDAGGVKGGACACRARSPREHARPAKTNGASRVRRNRVVLAVVATVKPLAEMPASPTGQTASSNSRGEGGQRKGRLPGERGIGRQTIAQGRPGFGCPVSPLCIACASVQHGGLYGCQPAPGLPCALSFERVRRKASLGQIMPRGCARLSAICPPDDLPYEHAASASVEVVVASGICLDAISRWRE